MWVQTIKRACPGEPPPAPRRRAGLLRRDLARHKGLPQVVGDRHCLAPRANRPKGGRRRSVVCPAGTGASGHAAVTLVAGDEPAVVGLSDT